ncbi:hypothetical protein ACFE04_031424 [Oxalis oulophora]
MAMTTSMNHISEDIMVEILLNLPVKSLCRFVCTCKAWYALIKSDHTFIQKHLHLSAEHLLLAYDINDFESGSTDKRFELISNGIRMGNSVDPNLCQALQQYTDVYGHCAGVLCLYNNLCGKGILWNPAIRETRALPIFPRANTKDRFWFGLRLGYDERINDYKVIVFSRLHKIFEYKFDFEYRVDMYSSRNDSWRRLEGNLPFYNVETWLDAKCFDGIFYWFQENNECGRLLSFHIEKEEFEEIILPDFVMGVPAYTTNLVKYNDRLAIIYGNHTHFPEERYFEIWVLSSESCWNNVLTIGPFASITCSIGFLEHGDKVLFEGLSPDNEYINNILIYNHQTLQLNDPGIRGNHIRALPYKESLVSVRLSQPRDFSEIHSDDTDAFRIRRPILPPAVTRPVRPVTPPPAVTRPVRPVTPPPPTYDYLELWLQWPHGHCRVRMCDPKKAQPIQFTIHGLWPTFANGTGVLVDPRNSPPFQLKDLRSQLSVLSKTELTTLTSCWPNLEHGTDQGFWLHEYRKHGLAARNEFHCSDYFLKAVGLQGKHDILPNIGVNPGSSAPFNSYETSLTNLLGGSDVFFIDCVYDPSSPQPMILHHVVVCYDKLGLNLTPCPSSQISSAKRKCTSAGPRTKPTMITLV